MTQSQLDFTQVVPPEVSAEMTAGMQAARDHANPEWSFDVYACVRAVALKKPAFTVDDVWEEHQRVNPHPETHHDCAIGAWMKEIAGYQCPPMEATKGFERSRRPGSHGNLLRVWRSRIYAGAQ